MEAIKQNIEEIKSDFRSQGEKTETLNEQMTKKIEHTV
jgi:hypothetical protein